MQVKLFHEILIWPLRLEQLQVDGQNSSKGSARNDRLDLWVQQISQQGRWSIADHYDRGTAKEAVTRYAEFVYFHPFVQRFLYGDGTHPSPIRIMKREDIRAVKLQMSDQPSTPALTLRVPRVHLYVEAQVALLVLEIAGNGLELAQVLEIQDRFRRVYPPFWYPAAESKSRDGWKPGDCPASVTWLNESGEQVGDSADYSRAETYLNFVRDNKAPPVSAHWAWLMEPLTAYSPSLPPGSLSYRQIVDERIPALCYLAVDSPEDLKDGDFVRIALQDGAGDSDTLPYARPFLSDFESLYCYDRFWDRQTGTNDNPKNTRYMGSMNIRYLCCGYGFAAVGSARNPFFTDEVAGVLAHFRHHYFQMGLIAHFQKASLLGFLDRLSDAVATLRRGIPGEFNREEFRTRVRGIEEELADFTTRYWFTEVSNQIQPRELFDLWCRHLGTGELYKKVVEEAARVSELVRSMQEERQTQVTVRLTMVAALAGATAVATSFFAMLIIVDGLKDLAKRLEWLGLGKGGQELLLFFLVLLVLVLLLLALIGSKRLARWFTKLAERELS